MKTQLETNTVRRANQIRHNSAKHWNCKVGEICFKECLKLAHTKEILPFEHFEDENNEEFTPKSSPLPVENIKTPSKLPIKFNSLDENIMLNTSKNSVSVESSNNLPLSDSSNTYESTLNTKEKSCRGPKSDISYSQKQNEGQNTSKNNTQTLPDNKESTVSSASTPSEKLVSLSGTSNLAEINKDSIPESSIFSVSDENTSISAPLELKSRHTYTTETKENAHISPKITTIEPNITFKQAKEALKQGNFLPSYTFLCRNKVDQKRKIELSTLLKEKLSTKKHLKNYQIYEAVTTLLGSDWKNITNLEEFFIKINDQKLELNIVLTLFDRTLIKINDENEHQRRLKTSISAHNFMSNSHFDRLKIPVRKTLTDDISDNLIELLFLSPENRANCYPQYYILSAKILSKALKIMTWKKQGNENAYHYHSENGKRRMLERGIQTQIIGDICLNLVATGVLEDLKNP